MQKCAFLWPLEEARSFRLQTREREEERSERMTTDRSRRGGSVGPDQCLAPRESLFILQRDCGEFHEKSQVEWTRKMRRMEEENAKLPVEGESKNRYLFTVWPSSRKTQVQRERRSRREDCFESGGVTFVRTHMLRERIKKEGITTCDNSRTLLQSL